MSTWAILTDTTLCTGCEECVKACKLENELGKDRPRRWKRRIDDLCSTRYTTMVRRPGDRFVRQQCRHCLEPACVSACLVGALQQKKDAEGRPEGPVIYDRDKCIGSKLYVRVCPANVIEFLPEDKKIRIYVARCTFCAQCVDACPVDALATTPEFLLADTDRFSQHLIVDGLSGEAGAAEPEVTESAPQSEIASSAADETPTPSEPERESQD